MTPPPLTHLAVIMDGNRRWARERGLADWKGHEEGIEALRRVSTTCRDLGIRYLTVYAFSTENWKRSEIEKQALFRIMEHYARNELPAFHRDHVRFRAIGNTNEFPQGVQSSMEDLVAQTAQYDTLHLSALLSYGGRADIVHAAQTLVDEAATKQSVVVTEEEFERRLWTRDLPPPELMVRTGGQMRLSNFLLWENAYAEFLFENTYWPAITAEHVIAWKTEYEQRLRNFGK